MEVLGMTLSLSEPGSLKLDIKDSRCDGCGKNMLYDGWESTGRNGGQSQSQPMSLIGISLELTASGSPPSQEAFLKKQLGEYEVNKKYKFCWECWLDSLYSAHTHFVERDLIVLRSKPNAL